MLTRIAMVMAIASSVLLFGASEDASACHRGDPGIPHGNQTSCDGGGVVDLTNLTNLVLVDANGDVVGRISSLSESHAQVILFTPDQRPFRLEISFIGLRSGSGFRSTTYNVKYEEPGCLATDTAYLDPVNAVPNIFYESALIQSAVGVIPWVGTSFEKQLLTVTSLLGFDGLCEDDVSLPSKLFYPAEQLTDEFGALVDNIHDLYPPPFRICFADDIDCIIGP